MGEWGGIGTNSSLVRDCSFNRGSRFFSWNQTPVQT